MRYSTSNFYNRISIFYPAINYFLQAHRKKLISTGFFYLEVGKRKWDLVFVPIGVALGMELFQLLHFANGRFDVMDITVSTGFWLLALFCTRTNAHKEPLFQTVNVNTVCCMISYSIVFLAHVTY